MPVRVRAIHVHDRSVTEATAGMRCALNLAGDVRRADVSRGDWVVAAAAHAPTMRIDVRLRLLPQAAGPLAHWTPVQLHLGAAEQSAHLALLEGRAMAPGEEAYAQLVLARPIAAFHGDRFILRSQAGQRVIAGGAVIDPLAGNRRIPGAARLARLHALDRDDAPEALAALLQAEPQGCSLDDFVKGRNLTGSEAMRLRQCVTMHLAEDSGGTLALGLAHWRELLSRLPGFIADWHASRPDSLGMPESALVQGWRGLALPAFVRAAVRVLLEQGVLARERLLLRLPSHQPRLGAEDQALLTRIEAMLRAAGLRPPIVGELAAALGMERGMLLDFLERVSRLGYLERVAPNRYFLHETVMSLSAIAAELAHASDDGRFDAAHYRNRSGIGRNLTIEVLEYLDRIGVTRYAGGRRRMAA
jgi:selenocysteine-specific elongation factor